MKQYYNSIICFCICCCAMLNANAQVQEAWVKTGIGFIHEFAVEKTGLVVDAGEYSYVGVNTHDFPGDGTGLEQTFIIYRFKPDGTQVYEVLQSVDDDIDRKLLDIAVDHFGNLYCCVEESKTLDRVNPRYATKFAVHKYGPTGALIWKRTYNDGESSEPRALTLDAAGNVYVTGDRNASGFISETWADDILTVKWSTDGVLQWARTYNGSDPGQGADRGRDVAVDNAGNVYVTGQSQLDGVISVITLKYNSAGTLLWQQRFVETVAQFTGNGNVIKVDISGFVYVAGLSDGRLIILKYSPDGAALWSKVEGGDNPIAKDLFVDGSGSVYFAGSSDHSNYAVIKYRFDGVRLWGKSHPDGAATSVAVDGSGNVYAGGRFGNKPVTIKYDVNGNEIWSRLKESPLADGQINPVAHSSLDNVFSLSFEAHNKDGNAQVYHVATLTKYTQCEMICPGDIVVNNDPGKCGAVVTFEPATLIGDCGGGITYSHGSGVLYPIGTTTVDVGSPATGATCSFKITVKDNEDPVLTCPASKTVPMSTGVCYATAASVNAGTATATDNCPNVIVSGTRSDNMPLNANYPGGTTTITWKAVDASGRMVSCMQTITVMDNQPPVISAVSLSKSVLAPPNHKLVDVTVNYTVTDNCSSSATIAVTSNEPETGISGGDQGPDMIKIDEHHLQLRAERDPRGDGRIYTITITAVDANGNTTTETRTVMVSHNIGSPAAGSSFKVGSTVNFSGVFWDVSGNKHTAQWVIDDKTSVKGAVSEPAGTKNGKVTGSYKFTKVGTYKLRMDITDQKGVLVSTTTAGDVEATVVIVDSKTSSGFIAGKGAFTEAVETAVLWTAYPNPSNAGFTLRAKGQASQSTMEVSDLMGRVIETRLFDGSQVITFGGNYRAGTYVVRINSGGKSETIKVVKF